MLIIVAGALSPLAGNAAAPASGSITAEKVVAYSEWTTESLYLAANIEDPMVVGNQTMPMCQPWQDDAIGFYLNFDPAAEADAPTSKCLRIIISAAGGATVQRGNGVTWKDDPSWFQPSKYGTIRYGVKTLGTANDSTAPDRGFQVELALSWDLLGVNPPINQRADEPLPFIGFAIACYSQGEMQSVSCWPKSMDAGDVNCPNKWGRIEFPQTLQPLTAHEPVAVANLVNRLPLVDGDLQGLEWVMAGVQRFTKKIGESGPPVQPGRQSVSLCAAWYLLDPPGCTTAHQPLDPPGPWAGPDTPLYHLLQLREVRRAGIDVLSVVLPAESTQREQTRDRLSALVSALKEFDRANSAQYLFNAPLLMPVVDLTGVAVGASAAERQQAVAALIDDFFGAVPVQYRVMVPNEKQDYCYPILLTNTPAALAAEENFTVELGARLQASWGLPIGWLLDAPWQKTKRQPGQLVRCAWDATAGMQQGDGPMLTAMVAPGVVASRQAYLPHQDGQLYENGWLKINGMRPDFVLLRSWNDFAQGSEIAPSNRYGYQFIDSTRLATIRLAQEHGFGVRILRHTLPAVVRPGATYPVEVLLKNGSVEKLVTREGFRVEYRLMQGDRKVRTGTATDQIVLLELSSARIRFNLDTRLDANHPLPAGAYVLFLDFRRNKISFLSGPLLAQTLGSVSIPFSIAEEGGVAQLVTGNIPSLVPANVALPVDLQVRNLGAKPWRKGAPVLRMHWITDAGAPVPGNAVLSCGSTVATGEIVTFAGKTPPTPAQPGWYRLLAEATGSDGRLLPVLTANVRVMPADVRANLVSVGIPAEVSGEQLQVEVPVAVRNTGLSSWNEKETRITYQWLAWDGQPLPGAAGSASLKEDVSPGGATTVRVPVALPAGAGVFRCAFGVECKAQQALLTGNPTENPLPVFTVAVRPGRFTPVSLQTAYNDYAAYADRVTDRVNLDNSGEAFPLEEFLPDLTNPRLGYQPGYGLAPPNPTAPGFRFGRFVRGYAPMVRAKGQAMELPEQTADAVHLAAMSVGHTNPVSFTIRYQSGDDQKVSVSISHWLDDPSFNEPVVLRSRYLRSVKGDDWFLQGSIFAYRLPVDPARKLKAIVLPDLSELCLFAVTLETPAKK
ncbi:MAG: hypothetical protein ACYDBB_03330 [Armatimonadota bacterium]